MMRLLLLLLLGEAVARNPCPLHCHCFPAEPRDPSQLKINCRWRNIHRNSFQDFTRNSTRSLTIRCTEKKEASHLPPLPFPALHHFKIKNCKLAPLPKDLFRVSEKLRNLHLEDLLSTSATKELEFEEGSLEKLDQLEKLTITGSQLSRLPKNSFCAMKDLKFLNLSGNIVESLANARLTENCDLPLIVLDLSRNRIRRLETGDFRRLGSLHQADLTGNNILGVSENAFNWKEDRSSLRKLVLRRNQISEVWDLPDRVEALDLSANLLPIIPSALSRLGSLIQLNLSGNSLDESTPFYLDSPRLRELHLDHNAFLQIPNSLFRNTTKLRTLSLLRNKISEIEDGVFKSLSELRSLNLAHNALTRVSPGGLEGLAQLETLNLANNSLETVDQGAFSATKALTGLDLSHNELKQVPSSLISLYHLRRLEMSSNKIDTIQKFLFVKLHNLETMRMDRNKLTEVGLYEFESLQSLKILDLSNNDIESIGDGSFKGCLNLAELGLERNQLSSLGESLKPLSALNNLRLSHNQLISIDYAQFPPALAKLNASHNRIEQLQNSNSQTTNQLRDVDLSYNQLRSLDAESFPLGLETGNFSRNIIQRISPDAMRNMRNLKRLQLEENELGHLNKSSFVLPEEGMKAEVFLKGNPLICSCQLEWMKSGESGKPSIEQMPEIPDFRELDCRQETTNKVELIYNAELLCSYQLICSKDCPCCDFDSCDCKNSCPPGCSCYHDERTFVNKVICSGNPLQSSDELKPSDIPMFATQIYLDDVKRPLISKNAFLGRYRLQHLYLNMSSVRVIEPRAFNGLTSLEVLDLSNNFLTELTGKEFLKVPKLLHLFLNNNRISYIAATAFDNLPRLQTLNLHGNLLQIFPVPLLGLTPQLFGLTLAGNPWKCDCGDRFRIQTWLPRHRDLVRDSQDLNCFENVSRLALNHSDPTALARIPPDEGKEVIMVNFWRFRDELNRTLCGPRKGKISGEDGDEVREYQSPNFHLIGGIAAAFAVLILISVCIGFIWRRKTSSPPKRKYQRKAPPSLHSSGTASTPVPLMAYDAFVTYSLDDEDFVQRELAPRLEEDPPYSQLCLLYRDLSTETYSTCHLIHDDIINAMKRSYCLLIILTQNFLEKEWEMVQIRTAHLCLLREKCQNVVFVLMDGVNLDSIDPILGHFLRTATRIRRSDPFFWDRLKESLPQRCAPSDSLTSSSHYSDLYGTIVPSSFL